MREKERGDVSPLNGNCLMAVATIFFDHTLCIIHRAQQDPNCRMLANDVIRMHQHRNVCYTFGASDFCHGDFAIYEGR